MCGSVCMCSVESIQNRALCFIFTDCSIKTSVSRFRKEASVLTLAQMCELLCLTLFHKIYYHNPSLKSSLLSPPIRVLRVRISTGQFLQGCSIFDSSNSFFNYFLALAIKGQNALPESQYTDYPI